MQCDPIAVQVRRVPRQSSEMPNRGGELIRGSRRTGAQAKILKMKRRTTVRLAPRPPRRPRSRQSPRAAAVGPGSSPAGTRAPPRRALCSCSTPPARRARGPRRTRTPPPPRSETRRDENETIQPSRRAISQTSRRSRRREDGPLVVRFSRRSRPPSWSDARRARCSRVSRDPPPPGKWNERTKARRRSSRRSSRARSFRALYFYVSRGGSRETRGACARRISPRGAPPPSPRARCARNARRRGTIDQERRSA